MIVFARHRLVAAAPNINDSALLLEGHWPAGEDRFAARYSLDESIDARHAWIDHAASALAEQAANAAAFSYPLPNGKELSLAYINALALRYYLVRLLRPIAFFDEVFASQTRQPIVLHAARPTDEDYTDVIAQLCRRGNVECRVHWHDRPATAAAAQPINGRLRRIASWFSRWHLSDVRQAAAKRHSAPRVLLCGNPRVLDPVCGELLRRGCRVAWLYDRFAFGAALRWMPRGVRQFTCDSASGRTNGLQATSPQPLLFRGIDLWPCVDAWLERTSAQRGAAQTRLIEQVAGHVAAWRPQALVVDEDTTPLPRIAIAAARVQGVRSLVVQHGAPRVRFGFAPLAADRFLAWGERSAEQLAGWGVPRARITIAGAANIDSVKPLRLSRHEVPTVLLFATTLPTDSRPDAVAYHLTAHTHDEALRKALAAVAGLPQVRLIIKLHPRCQAPGRIERLVAEFPHLNCRFVRRANVAQLLSRAHVVLNFGSSAGIEAAHAGLPVIELLPAGGSRKLTPAAAWGLFGSAANFEQLCTLLDSALAREYYPAARTDVFAATGDQAARAIAEAVLQGETSLINPSPITAAKAT